MLLKDIHQSFEKHWTRVAMGRQDIKYAKGKDFDLVKNESKDIWNKKLNKIVVEGGKKEDRVKFYTGLYHALLGRGLSSDTNGDYPKIDGKIGKTALNKDGTPEYQHYNFGITLFIFYFRA